MKRINLSILLFAVLCGCQPHELYKDKQVLMGTFVEVISPAKEASSIVFSEIKRIEGLLSKYKPDSEISRLNRNGISKVSPDTFYIMSRSKEFSRLSAGAFDITVAPLLDLWGFTSRDYIVPAEPEIRRVLNLVGSDKIILHEDENMIEFKLPGMKVDLGAIGKGFALDCAVKKLKEKGINSCLINAGGQVYALGTKYGASWKAAIRNPRKEGLLDSLNISNKSVSTSGDYEQYFIRGKNRYSHIFNPKTGYPVDSGILSVTVIADDGLTADALSTAIFVLGKTKGEELIKQFTGARIVRIIEEKDAQHN